MKNRGIVLQVVLAAALVLRLVVPASAVGAMGTRLLPQDRSIG